VQVADEVLGQGEPRVGEGVLASQPDALHLGVEPLLAPEVVVDEVLADTGPCRGSSPLQWLLRQRIMHAQRLLETTDLNIDAVARQAGFTGGVALRPHFRRVVGVAPQTYRDTFHARAGYAVRS
jgi:hypothetical protein